MDKKLIRAIEAKMLNGKTRDVILEEAEADGIDPAGIDTAMAMIASRWIEEAEESPESVRAFHIRTLKHLYAKANKLADYKTCLQIMKHLGKVQRIDEIAAPPAKRKPDAEVGQLLKLIRK